MAIEDAFELVKQLATITPTESVPLLLRQFESSRGDFRSERLRQRINRVFTTSGQVGQLSQVEHPIACFFRNWLYQLTPTWLADLQFKWLFDYRPERPINKDVM
jgi:2-polyprenyl-6-methoxyphenol hydroxylase-like FAD-dependent oxidoreductase